MLTRSEPERVEARVALTGGLDDGAEKRVSSFSINFDIRSHAEEVAAGAIGHCRRSDLLCHFSTRVRRAVTNLLNPIPLAPKFMLKDLLISRRERHPRYPLWEDRPRAFQKYF